MSLFFDRKRRNYASVCYLNVLDIGDTKFFNSVQLDGSRTWQDNDNEKLYLFNIKELLKQRLASDISGSYIFLVLRYIFWSQFLLGTEGRKVHSYKVLVNIKWFSLLVAITRFSMFCCNDTCIVFYLNLIKSIALKTFEGLKSLFKLQNHNKGLFENTCTF